MATGTWGNPNETEELTITLNTTNFSLSSWGKITGIRKGNTVYIRLYGIIPKVSASSGTTIDVCTFSGSPSKMSVVASLLNTTGEGAGRCIIDLDADGNQIYATGLTADNNARYTYLVFPV